MLKFKRDPYFLLRDTLQNFFILVLLCSILFFSKDKSLIPLPPGLIFIFPFTGMILSGSVIALLHNASHGNFGKGIGNEFLGQIAGTLMLYGFKGFQIGHEFHHRYPDDPKMDVSSPAGYTFWSYVFHPLKDTLEVLQSEFFSNFGVNSKTRWIYKTGQVSFIALLTIRLLFFFLLLGPQGFFFGYLPFWFFAVYTFAHINFSTHVPDQNGGWEVLDRTDTLFIKVMNFLSWGSYYHKRHHMRPDLVNPGNLKLNSKLRYLTFPIRRVENG